MPEREFVDSREGFSEEEFDAHFDGFMDDTVECDDEFDDWHAETDEP